jgi:hypothetical protein
MYANVDPPTLKGFFGGLGDKNDPILYNTSLPPTNHLHARYNTENLGSIRVDDLFDCAHYTVVPKAIKTSEQAEDVIENIPDV